MSSNAMERSTNCCVSVATAAGMCFSAEAKTTALPP